MQTLTCSNLAATAATTSIALRLRFHRSEISCGPHCSGDKRFSDPVVATACPGSGSSLRQVRARGNASLASFVGGPEGGRDDRAESREAETWEKDIMKGREQLADVLVLAINSASSCIICRDVTFQEEHP